MNRRAFFASVGAALALPFLSRAASAASSTEPAPRVQPDTKAAVDELYKLEVWQTRADVIDSLKATGLFEDRWLLEHFTPLTKEEIDAALKRD